MSDPKRYDPQLDKTGEYDIVMVESSIGDFVRWQDYAQLKAENDRIRSLFAETERLTLLDGEWEAAPAGTYAKLGNEIRELRNAGDRMDLAISTPDHQAIERHKQMKMTDAEYKAVTMWRKVKENHK